MRLWFSPASEVPIYRQLVTQIVLAILSGDLKPGERLPSTRELARRFSIHPNTVARVIANWRAKDGWSTGMGAACTSRADAALSRRRRSRFSTSTLRRSFEAVRELQLPAAAIQAARGRMDCRAASRSFSADRSRSGCAGDFAHRDSQADHWPATAIPVEEAAKPQKRCWRHFRCAGRARRKMVRAVLPAGIELIPLQIRSANQMAGSRSCHRSKGKLIGVVSELGRFSRNCARRCSRRRESIRILLVVRNPKRPRWQRGLEQTGAIICDAHTAATRELPKGPRVFVFSVLADAVRVGIEPILR